ncbi:UNVERIFIED_CONTAM: hypothetical protein K2H54_003666 [Gekko kuhli]
MNTCLPSEKKILFEVGAAFLSIKASTFQNGLFPHIHTHLIQNFEETCSETCYSLFLYLHKNGKIFQIRFTLGRTFAPHVLAPEIACNGTAKWAQTKGSFPVRGSLCRTGAVHPPPIQIYFDEAHVALCA